MQPIPERQEVVLHRFLESLLARRRPFPSHSPPL